MQTAVMALVVEAQIDMVEVVKGAALPSSVTPYAFLKNNVPVLYNHNR